MASRYKKIKFSLVKWVVKSGMLHLFKVISRRRHIILNFHRVRPHGLPSDPFDSCPSISVELFKEILFYLKKHYEIVSVRSFCKRIDQLRPLAAITFDDGWQDNYEIAFPILQELKIPATIFVTTGKIGSYEPFWQQKLGRLFHSANQGENGHAEEKLKRMLGLGNQVPLNQDIFIKIVNHWKLLSFSEVENKFPSGCLGPDMITSKKPLFLTAEQMREMALSGVEFGSHTVNHTILTSESETVIKRELNESLKTLEAITGENTYMLAYPNGNVSKRVVQIALDLGYKIGCTTQRAAVGKRDDLMKLPRFDLDWDALQDCNGKFNPALFQWELR